LNGALLIGLTDPGRQQLPLPPPLSLSDFQLWLIMQMFVACENVLHNAKWNAAWPFKLFKPFRWVSSWAEHYSPMHTWIIVFLCVHLTAAAPTVSLGYGYIWDMKSWCCCCCCCCSGKPSNFCCLISQLRHQSVRLWHIPLAQEPTLCVLAFASFWD